MTTPTPTLHELKALWLAAKAAEAAANTERLAIERAILTLLPSKVEGTVTDTDSGVSATFKVTRKTDTPALQAEWTSLSANVQSAFTWKADVSARQLSGLQELDPAAYLVAAKYLTATPAKPSISIKEST